MKVPRAIGIHEQAFRQSGVHEIGENGGLVTNVKGGITEKFASKMCQSGGGWEMVHGLRDVGRGSRMLARRMNNLAENPSTSSELVVQSRCVLSQLPPSLLEG